MNSNSAEKLNRGMLSPVQLYQLKDQGYLYPELISKEMAKIP
jgi:hypothetical protein